MPYIPPEVIEQARQIDLLTYLQNCEPHELVRISGNNYTTRTHDSLKISNGKWMWWSQRIGGYNALDYLVKVRGFSFVEAVETLMGKAAVMPTLTVRPKQEEKPKTLLLPEKSKTTDKIREYLFSRGIDAAITDECIKKGVIFDSLPRSAACSIAGISKLHTDAATITPAAKPVRARWMPSRREFFKKNTQPAPRLVPRKGIKIPQNASCIM